MELTLPTSFKNELVAEAAARVVAELAGFDEETIEEIETALGEACINAIEHSQSPTQRFKVTVTPMGDALVLTVEDEGIGFAGDTGVPPSIAEKLESAYKRGWGLMLIEELMDEIEISATEGAGTVVRMRKYRRGSEA